MRYLLFFTCLLLSSASSYAQQRSILAKESEGSEGKVQAKTASYSKTVDDEKSDEGLRKVERKELKESPAEGDGEKYKLVYKFKPGTRIISDVAHLAKTEMKIDNVENISNSRTVSHKAWDIVKAEKGEMTFEYRILDVDMSQKVGEKGEITYTSGQKAPVPPQFQNAADSTGKVLSKVTIDEQGMVLYRSDETNPPHLGMGDITLPVPANPIAVGSTWEIPRELRIRREDGSIKSVRFRELFRLDKVSLGVATIAVRSEMITIVNDPKEEAQVLQQLSNGTIKFDLDAGCMISKELSWDNQVIGFSGGGSFMKYSARLDENVSKTESISVPTRTAAKK